MIDTRIALVEPTQDTSLVVSAEIERMREFIAALKAGRIDGDSFRRFRLQNGIYGIRGQTDIQMVRVRVPLGRLTALQLQALGRVTEAYARGIGHITTRQDIQLYWVPLERVVDLLTQLAAVGVTTRETSGSVVRNVSIDPLAGVAADEAFDVRPHADAIMRFWLRNPLSQNMPRKIKIAFSGSSADRAATAMHDIGALATLREVDRRPQRGFQLFVGGGLSSSPHVAQLLEDWTPEDELLPTIEAILRVFDRLGNRQTRARARLKFLIDQMGIQAFRDLVFKERQVLSLVRPQPYPAFEAVPGPAGMETAPTTRGNGSGNGHSGSQPDADYARWLESNVILQKQLGYSAVTVVVPGGDLSASQFRNLVSIVREFARGECLTTIAQNIVLRWVPQQNVHDLYVALREIGLAQAGAGRISKVIGCPGAHTCNTAITTSHRLVLELTRHLTARPDLSVAPDLRGVDIKVGGCPNSCGHHQVAAIGFYGGARRVNGVQTPHYMMLLGGRVLSGNVVFGKPVTAIPAKRVLETVERVISLYRAGRRDAQETFHDWIGRVGVASLRDKFEDLKDLDDPAVAPDLYRDWGQDFPFKLQVGESECAV